MSGSLLSGLSRASLGSLIAEGADQINPIRVYWWLVAFPAGFLVTTLLALNLIGDGLRDGMCGGLENELFRSRQLLLLDQRISAPISGSSGFGV